jgi:hypothetical protein
MPTMPMVKNFYPTKEEVILASGHLSFHQVVSSSHKAKETWGK